MKKEYVLQKIREKGIVAVVRAKNADTAMKTADACIEGGITAIEITFTVPGALGVIKTLSEEYAGTDVMTGAGTVMNKEDSEKAIEAGARFIVSPYFDAETVRLCREKNIAVMPGVMTVREAVMAMNAGADILKIFPGELFGPAIIKAFKGPLPDAVMMPTGGVTAENAGDWIKAGAVAVGAGGSLTSGAAAGDYGAVTRMAKLFLENIARSRRKD